MLGRAAGLAHAGSSDTNMILTALPGVAAAAVTAGAHADQALLGTTVARFADETGIALQTLADVHAHTAAAGLRVGTSHAVAGRATLAVDADAPAGAGLVCAIYR